MSIQKDLNVNLTRTVGPQGVIEYRNNLGRCVKYIASSGFIYYDDNRSAKSRVPYYWYSRKDGGPCCITADGRRFWHDFPKKKVYNRPPTVGNNKRSNHKNYRFIPIKYGLQRIKTPWVIYYNNFVGFSSSGKPVYRQTKTIFMDGRVSNYPSLHNGPNFIGDIGYRTWEEWEEGANYVGLPTKKGNPKKTWGNKYYIMERYEYPKT
jgi:hypothetical protein